MNNLAIFIKEHREKLNISMRKLSELSNISTTEIRRLENGVRKNPSFPTLKSIANALHVRYEDILIAAGYLDSKPESSGIAAIISNLKYLTDDELEKVQTTIDLLRAKPK